MLSYDFAPCSPPLHVSKLDLRHSGRLRKRDNWLTGGGSGEDKSYDRKKAWSSKNYSILSDLNNVGQKNWRNRLTNWIENSILLLISVHCKKGYCFSRSQLGCPWKGIISLFLARESLVRDIRLGTGTLFKSLIYLFQKYRTISAWRMYSNY